MGILTLEEISDKSIPPTKASVESGSSRRYAESKVTAKANSPFSSSKILGDWLRQSDVLRTAEPGGSRQRSALSARSSVRSSDCQVTQLNNGKKTAGIDGKLALTFKQRFELEEELRIKANNWKHKGLRQIPIPKKDGTKRILKVPTISDRAWQCLAKYALEPAHEATFHARSYGFRNSSFYARCTETTISKS